MCSNSSLLRARNVWTFIDSLTSESRVWNFDPQFVQKKKENKIESNSSPFRIPIIKKITREYILTKLVPKNSNYYFEIRVINNEEKRKKWEMFLENRNEQYQ